MSSGTHAQIAAHLLSKVEFCQEELCFVLWFPSTGSERQTALLHTVLLPQDGERVLSGNVSFMPSYVERVLGEALAAGAGLALLHSHLAPGWQRMSTDDVNAELRLAPRALAVTGLPLVGLTIGTDGAWSARFWEKVGPRQFTRKSCDRVRVVGEALRVTYDDHLIPPPAFREELRRTVSAWGPRVQADAARLVIGIVGVGSVGSLVAESVSRMGVADVRLIDFDSLETVNLDRILHATPARVGDAKVRILADTLPNSATAGRFQIKPIEFSVAEEEGLREALNCDVLFSCVDRPWARHVLNFIAYAHLIPVIDGGIRAEATRNGKGMRRADIRAHVAAPDRQCLECIGQYDSGLVAMERDGYLDDPSYIAGLPVDHVVRRNENVFAFSVLAAGFQMGQLISLVAQPLGIGNPGTTIYHVVNNTLDSDISACKAGCLFNTLSAKGDASGLIFTGTHAIAERTRASRLRARTSSPRDSAFFRRVRETVFGWWKRPRGGSS